MLDVVEDHFEVLVAEGGSRSSESNFERWRHVIVSTVEFGTPGMLKSMFSSSVARLNSLSALDDAMSRCSAGTNCSFAMCVLALDFTGFPVLSWACMTRMSSDSFTGFPVLSEEPSSLCKRLSSISCERDVFSFLHKNTFCVLRFPPIDHRLDWVWIGLVWKIQHEVLLQKTVEQAFQLADVQL